MSLGGDVLARQLRDELQSGLNVALLSADEIASPQQQALFLTPALHLSFADIHISRSTHTDTPDTCTTACTFITSTDNDTATMRWSSYAVKALLSTLCLVNSASSEPGTVIDEDGVKSVPLRTHSLTPVRALHHSTS